VVHLKPVQNRPGSLSEEVGPVIIRVVCLRWVWDDVPHRGVPSRQQTERWHPPSSLCWWNCRVSDWTHVSRDAYDNNNLDRNEPRVQPRTWTCTTVKRKLEGCIVLNAHNAVFARSGPLYVIGLSMGPSEFWTQTISRPLQNFLQGSLGDRPTDIPRYWVVHNRRHLPTYYVVLRCSQNLPGPVRNTWLTLFQISSQSVHFRRSYSRTCEHRSFAS